MGDGEQPFIPGFEAPTVPPPTGNRRHVVSDAMRTFLQGMVVSWAFGNQPVASEKRAANEAADRIVEILAELGTKRDAR